MPDRQITLSCIDKVLDVHAHDPFGVLRETGIQAEIREKLLDDMPERVAVAIAPARHPSRFAWPAAPSTKRVHLEMKIGFPAEVQARKRADVVVLRREAVVHLTCAENGPGDVLAALRPADVSVAIEVKASPSRTQLHAYSRDVMRLLDLSQNCGIDGFFVLVDKSHSRYGSANHPRWNMPAVCADDWAAMRQFLGGGVHLTPQEPEAASAVATICDLCPDGHVRHTFAWRN